MQSQLAENPALIDNGFLAHRIEQLQTLASTGPLAGNGLTLLDDVHLLDMPDVREIVQGFIPDRGLIVLWGAPGIGKSTLALDLALSVASGRPWLTGRTSAAGAGCLCRGGGGVINSSLASKHGKRRKAFPLDQSLHFYVVPQAVQLPDAADMDRLIAAITPLAPVLVVFDTLARCSVGIDENAVQDMGRVIASAGRMQSQLGAGRLSSFITAIRAGVRSEDPAPCAGPSIRCSNSPKLTIS